MLLFTSSFPLDGAQYQHPAHFLSYFIKTQRRTSRMASERGKADGMKVSETRRLVSGEFNGVLNSTALKFFSFKHSVYCSITPPIAEVLDPFSLSFCSP